MDEEKKESIEEILSDLNNLLNKMPSILSDIKAPETRPVEFFKSEKEHIKTEHDMEKPAEEIVAEPVKEPVMEPPEEVKIPADNGADVGSTEQIPGREPAFITDEVTAQTADNKEKIEIDKQNIKELAAALSIEERREKIENLYDQTKSFGVPDIDDLFKIAEEPVQQNTGADYAGKLYAGRTSEDDTDKEFYQEKAEPGKDAVPVPEGFGRQAVPGAELQEREFAEINAQGGTMNSDKNPKDEDISRNQNNEESQEKPHEEISDEEFEPEKTIKLEDLKKMESAFQELSTESQAAEPQTGQPADDMQETASPMKDENEMGDALMQAEQQAQVEIKPEIAPADTEETPEAGKFTPDIPVAADMEQAGDAQAGQVEPAGDEVKLQPEAGFIEEQPALEIQHLQASAEPGEEKTLVLEPGSIRFERAQFASLDLGGQAAPTPTSVGGQEISQDFGDKTMMVSEEALTTSRSRQSADLSSLINNQPPEQVPPERIKSVGFLYSMEEEKMCANLLQEIDSICSKSRTKPMFVKRAFVKVFEPDIKGNYILEVVSQTQGMGLVCVGNIPQENIYEVENVFNSSNVFFRHINQENFNHASVVNLIADLIIL